MVETRFVDMGVGSKIVFIGKLIVFFCTFGFAFPTLLNDYLRRRELVEPALSLHCAAFRITSPAL